MKRLYSYYLPIVLLLIFTGCILNSMVATGFYNEAKWANLTVANGYNNGQDLGSAATRPGPTWGLLGFGGVLATVGDLHRWQDALRENTVLSTASTEALFTPHIAEDDSGESFYGYGWVIMEIPEFGKIIWHDGATDSHNSVFIYSVEADTLVIVLSNKIDNDAQGAEIFYAPETGFLIGRSFLTNDFSEYPMYVE